MPEMPDGQIDQFIARNVCARCYGDLVKVPAENRTWRAVCIPCGDAWGGATIRRTTAERRGQQAINEALEVRINLPDLFPNPHRGRRPAEIVAEMFS